MTTTIGTRKRRRLTEDVATGLLRDIVSGKYGVGEMLPPENELGSEYEVSRTVVREAIKIVEHKSVLSVIQGRGSTVRPLDEWNALDPDILACQLEQSDNSQVFEELTVVRLALECEMAAQAALHLTPDLQQRMRDVIEGGAAFADDPDGYLEFDYDFHRLVTEASGNRIARGIMASLEGPLRASRHLTSRLPGAFESAQPFHRSIFEAIAARDPDLARRTMRAHLEESRRMLQLSGSAEANGARAVAEAS